MSDTNNPIEQYLHITELKAELNELAHGDMVMEMAEGLDQGLEESFLEHVLAYERAEQVPFRVLLEREGLVIPSPDELTDEELSAKLDEVIQVMGKLRNYLNWTDHLSDRELYTHLVEVTFEETVPDLPPSEAYYPIDILSSYPDEVYLKYYADEAERAHWAEDFPDMVIPPHEDPPYDRDRHLPKLPSRSAIYDDPEVDAQWRAEQYKELLVQLADAGIVHGNISTEPVSYAPPMASIWAVEGKDCEGKVEWWAVNGECPFVVMSAKDVPSPRDFLREVSRQWQDDIDALDEEFMRAQNRLEPWNRPLIPLDRFDMRKVYVSNFERWAADDSAWDEEWR